MQFLVLALVLHVLYGAAGGASKQKAKSVTTLIEAKWEVTPLVLEIAEYLRDESEYFLWEFVDGISALHPPLADLGKYKLCLLCILHLQILVSINCVCSYRLFGGNINPLKMKHICFIQGVSAKHALNTLSLGYKSQSINLYR